MARRLLDRSIALRHAPARRRPRRGSPRGARRPADADRPGRAARASPLSARPGRGGGAARQPRGDQDRNGGRRAALVGSRRQPARPHRAPWAPEPRTVGRERTARGASDLEHPAARVLASARVSPRGESGGAAGCGGRRLGRPRRDRACAGRPRHRAARARAGRTSRTRVGRGGPAPVPSPAPEGRGLRRGFEYRPPRGPPGPGRVGRWRGARRATRLASCSRRVRRR